MIQWVFVFGLIWWWVTSILAFKQVTHLWRKIVLVVFWIIVLPISLLLLFDTLRLTDHAFEIGFFAPPVGVIELCAPLTPANF
jgi:hypothetical protein